RVLQVDAEDSKSAEQLARRRGLLVSAVHPAPSHSPVDALDDLVDAVESSRRTIDYQQPRPRPAGSAGPPYAGLRIGASVLMIFAMLYYVCGVVFLSMGIKAAVE